MSTKHATLLSALSAGCGGCVLGILAQGEASHRLMQLGICEGCEVRVIRMGDPMIVQVLGTRVGLAHVLASQVSVAGGAL